VQDATSVPVTVITNARNVGFPAAINQGVQNASGEFLVMLNNDAVVTELWLDQLIALTRLGANGGAPEVRGGQAENGDKLRGAVATTAPASEATPRLTPHTSLPTPRIGLVGPMSNYVSPPQRVGDVPYGDLDAMHAFAGRWRAEHWGKWFTAPKLSGFCVLMTRAVYDAVGGLDERFGLGLFDDDDLAVRARRAGFELAVAHDLFVHHFGSRTFAGNGIDAEALLQANERRFADKWGHDRPLGRRIALRPWDGYPKQPRMTEDPSREEIGPQMDADGHRSDLHVPPTHLRSSAAICGQETSSNRLRGKPRVTLTMIVRDEQDNLPRALESVRGSFDEIVVVDTGSTDRTREIAREFGARVFDFAWIDDFAAARNVALSHATGDFAFWLDADDVVDPSQRETLRSLLDG
jgi:GT2 family glycosyltransferase